ncbi:putative uncharacterized protein [Firmicutes bacterium CAG:582]|mgnify:FL=1|nr:putative uncharacterized protein [Firmicutes bacterium CAG:582]
MSLELIIVLALLLLFMVGFMFIEPAISKHKVKNNNEYGSARFSNFNEIKKNFKKEKISNIKESGVPIWFSKDYKYVWFDRETPHYTYLGSTGSGKSVTAVIPMCSFVATAKNKRSVFITDPKGEIFNTTSKMFKDNGYNVLTLDFRHPEMSNHFNILEPIIKEYEKYIDYEKKSIVSKKDKVKFNNLAMTSLAETNRLITSLATMIMQEKTQQKDPFWNNSARNLLEGLIGFFLEEYKKNTIKRNQITMTSIRKFQNSSMQEKNFNKFKTYIDRKDYGSKSKDSLTSILNASDNTYKSITAVFGEKMSLFDDVNVANVTSDSDFDFDLLGREATALFIIVPDEDKVYFTLVTIIVGLLYKELVKLANSKENKKLPVQIDWLLDEFANCPPLADIEALVSVARSRGMRFHFFIQSFSQLDNVYGKEVAQIILDNCGLIYLKTNTQDTAEQISKRLGKTTISSSSISQSLSLLDYNGNKSTSLMARDLLTPDEVKQLHYKTIIFPIIGYPIFRDTVMYNKFSCYEKGEIERKVNSLKQLDNTYFTVEQIKSPIGGRFKKVDDELNMSAKDFYKEQREAEEQELLKAIEQIKDIIKDNIINFEYKTKNNRTFSVVSLNKDIGEMEKSLIKGQLDNKIYHIEISNNDNGKNVIEIHLKSTFNQEQELGKEKNK